MSETEAEPIEYMLTTFDNPFNPFTRFNEWLAYDTRMGYDTAAFLARVAYVSHEMSEPDQALAIQDAINQIVEENVTGMYRKVSRSFAKELESNV
jgi:hypothetical protein